MSGTPHGNAQWADQASLKNRSFQIGEVASDAFLLGKWVKWSSNQPHPLHKALYNGEIYEEKNESNCFLGIKGDGHILTVAPTRSGKGVGLVIPNLLHYNQSVIVIDPKGENYQKTRAYRLGCLEQHCWRFDPFSSQNSSQGIAILKRAKEMFDTKRDDLLAEVSRIAEAIVIRKKDEKDPFFNNAAQIMIKDAILLTLYEFEESEIPPLSNIRSFFVDEKKLDDLSDELEQKIALSEIPNEKHLLPNRALRELKSYMGNRDVLATVIMQTEFLEDENVAKIVDCRECCEIFDPPMLNEGKNSIYLIIPPQHLNRQSRFLRLFITLCMDTITRRSAYYDDQNNYNNVLFILDEIAQLGSLDCIQKAVALAAGYKMTLWMFWQDLAQLKGLYPEDWMSFLSNAKIQQFFGCNDIETAKYIAERCGPRTQESYSANVQHNSRGLLRSEISTGNTQTLIAGELLRPSEILRADNSIIFNFVQGNFPFLCKKIKYYEDEILNERSKYQ